MSQHRAVGDFPGSLAQAISKPVNISSLEQQQSRGLDTSQGVRLAGYKARGYTKDRTTQPLKRFNKCRIQPTKIASYHCSTTRGRTWINNNSHTCYWGKVIHPAPLHKVHLPILYLYNILVQWKTWYCHLVVPIQESNLLIGWLILSCILL